MSCECPGIAAEFSNIPVRVTLVNGAEVSLVGSGPNAVYIAYHWFNPDGAARRLDAGRFAITEPLVTGSSRQYTFPIAVPDKAGSYVLRVTLVQEWVRWFDEDEVGVFADLRIEVQTQTWWTDDTRHTVPYGHIHALNRANLRPFLSHGGLCRPLMLHVETVNICNLKCIICPYAEMTRTRETMPMPLFERIVADYCDMGGGDVVLTPQVGDVLLDKALVERIRFLKRQPAIGSLGFVTNAVNAHVIPDADIEYIVNACDRINISVYGLDEEEYAAMTLRPNRYARMVESIQRMLKLNRRCQLAIAARLLKKYEDGFIRNWMAGNFGREVPYEAVTSFGNWAGAIDTSKPLPFDGTWAGPDVAAHLEEGGPCAYPIVHLKVVVNGDVQFCSCVDHDSNAENKIGNVTCDSLTDIYNGERARRLWRDGLRMCKGCTHRRPIANFVPLARLFEHPVRSLGV